MRRDFHFENMTPPAGRKSVEELHKIAASTRAPFIVKGIMTVRGALKAEAAGADAIVVSNHGGRVLDQCPATAEVLEEIAKAVKGKMKILWMEESAPVWMCLKHWHLVQTV